jgi:hypothetical protein
LQFAGESLEMAAGLEHDFHLKKFLQRVIGVIEFGDDLHCDFEAFRQIFSVFEFHLVFVGAVEELDESEVCRFDFQF